MEDFKVILELSLREAEILCNAIQGYSPPLSDELITIMIYNRILKQIQAARNKK